MASLHDVLRQYIGTIPAPIATAGSDETQGASEEKASTSFDKEGFQRGLEQVKKDNRLYFIICVAMVLTLFIISIVFVLANLDRPGAIKIAMAAFGISTAGLMAKMIGLWREKSNTEFLLLLAPNVDADTIKTIVGILAKRILSGKA